ncbi:DUF6221 family protein [Streptomyces sp. NPDC127114]|uniref:DUF6221 family protein n=1 Tax=Streptomyces sp. NPDC127114 TaxID=3345366 RepID=UPI003629B7CB
MVRSDFPAMMEFLRERLREDEAAARAVRPGKNEGVAGLQARVLADVAAKRRLMEWVEEPHQRMAGDGERAFWETVIADAVANTWMGRRVPVIYALVAAYADHPHFRPEWGPEEDECEPGEEKLGASRS